MNTTEEIYLIGAMLEHAAPDGQLDLNNPDVWKKLFLNENTKIHEDYFLELAEQNFIYYEEIGEDGFKPIIMCSVDEKTRVYYKKLLNDLHEFQLKNATEIDRLNDRIKDILTFNPKRLSNEIKATEQKIQGTKKLIASDPTLTSLSPQLAQIEAHFSSISKVADNYEDIYKNIILPVKEEGKAGVRQTVKWAIIGIAISSIVSIIITLLTAK
ncbi:hypothetical protein [Edaphocola aurantiacus]|uniref:hypothetical protein n=1 Tax=Edaphocola aurantiacus TaxID=2601682 RepID=UPI001C9557F9|nr:hypothetical protein [Edaphocola aurantiacus]